MANTEGTRSEDATDARITQLEETVAHHARTIEELSAALAEQWKLVDRLQSRLAALTGDLRSLEEQMGGPTPVTRPPHW